MRDLKVGHRIIKAAAVMILLLSMVFIIETDTLSAVEITAGNSIKNNLDKKMKHNSNLDQIKNIYSENISYNYYTVKPGDSLYKISRRTGVSISRIKELNNLSSSLIFPGQKLKISIKDEEDDKNRMIYTVQAGDSLYKISLKFDVSYRSIMEANNLNSYWIYPGQKLIIPAADAEPEPEPPSEDETENGSNDSEKNYQRIEGRVKVSNQSGDFFSTAENDSAAAKNSSSLEQSAPVPLADYSKGEEYKEDEIIIRYRSVISSQQAEEIIAADNLVQINQMETEEGRLARYRLPEDKNLKDLITEYNQLENILYAEPNYIYYPTAAPDDNLYSYQWNLRNINLPSAWDLTAGSRDVTVAVIDTGIIDDHPDLKGNLLPGADFVGGYKSYPVENYSMTDDDPLDESTYSQGGSHGTHVAGIIGAVTNNSLGVAGVSWKVKILPVRALTRTGGTSWDIAEAVYYTLDQDVDIINMSLGGNHNSLLQQEAVREAYNQGVTVIAASGNEGQGSVYYPARYQETIAVGAVNKENQHSSYSNYGPEIDVTAPGGDYGQPVYSTWGYFKDGETESSYNGMIGTSMAAPHVSGLAALLISRGITGPEAIRTRLKNTAVDRGEKGEDKYYGAGVVDAYAALLKPGNSPRKREIKAAAVLKNGDRLLQKSDMVELELAGGEEKSFVLEKVESSAEFLIVWQDVNSSGVIDRGDYYGEAALNEKSLNQKIDITAYYLGENLNLKIMD